MLLKQRHYAMHSSKQYGGFTIEPVTVRSGFKILIFPSL